jgi:hypothetical protein
MDKKVENFSPFLRSIRFKQVSQRKVKMKGRSFLEKNASTIDSKTESMRRQTIVRNKSKQSISKADKAKGRGSATQQSWLESRKNSRLL